jgi:hypothetical protein
MEMKNSAGKTRLEKLWILVPVLAVCFVISLAGPDRAWSAEPPADIEQMILDRLEAVEIERDLLLDAAKDAIAAGVPEETVATIVEHSLNGGVDGKAIAEELEVVISTHEKGLPTDPLASKILEGLTKGIDQQGIQTALEKVTERMATVAQIIGDVDLGPLSDEERDDLVIHSSSAMANGLDEERLAEILQIIADALDRSDAVRPADVMELLSDVVGYGIDSETLMALAKEIVNDKDAGIEALQAFIDDFVEERVMGGGPAVDPGPATAGDASGGTSDTGSDTADDATDNSGDVGSDTAGDASGGASDTGSDTASGGMDNAGGAGRP